MLKNRLGNILFLVLLCFGCQYNATITEDQITVDDQIFTLSTNTYEGTAIGQVELKSAIPVNFFLVKNANSFAFAIDSITGELFFNDAEILNKVSQDRIELILLTSCRGNYIDYGVQSNIYIDVFREPKIECWDSRENHSEVSAALVNSFMPSVNYENPECIKATAWTYNLQNLVTRTFFKFDLQSVPQDINIIDAKLYLYSPSENNINNSHSTLSGPNSFYIRRITSDWQSTDITWNNQPEYTIEGESLNPSSTDDKQNYEIDITYIIKDIVEKKIVNYGFLIMLKQESFYRQICFASNSYHNQLLRPILRIRYQLQNI
jgi:hypothetical protein